MQSTCRTHARLNGRGRSCHMSTCKCKPGGGCCSSDDSLSMCLSLLACLACLAYCVSGGICRAAMCSMCGRLALLLQQSRHCAAAQTPCRPCALSFGPLAPRHAPHDPQPCSSLGSYSRWLTEWVEKLEPSPSEELLIVARGQHIQRWTSPRNSYPDVGGFRGAHTSGVLRA